MAFRYIQVRKKRKHSATAQEILDRLDKYIQSGIKEPIRLLKAVFDSQRQNISYQDIREAIVNGGFDDKAVDQWTAAYSDFVVNDLVPVWENAMKAGAVSQPLLEDKGILFSLDINRPHVLDWIDRRGASFVTAVTAQQKEAMRGLIKQYTYGKYSVDELAKVIRPCVGLTVGQSSAVTRYYDALKENMRKEHPRMAQASLEAKCREKATKYAERLHRQRSFVIAQTEMAFAYNHGTHEAMRQAMEKGLIGALEKRWVTSGDENVCPECDVLNGTQIGFDAPFDFGRHKILFEGQEQVPPLHPRCACAVEYIEVGDAAVVPEEETQEPVEVPGTMETTDIPEHEDIPEKPLSERTADYLDNLTASRLAVTRNNNAQLRVEAAEKYVAEQMGVSREEAGQLMSEGLQVLVDESEFAIHIRPDALLGVLEDGRFKVSHDFTDETIGYHWNRANHEWQAFNVPKDSDNADRPVYGMLVPKYDPANKDVVDYYINGPGGQYGGIVVIIDKGSVINNTSFTLGDSADYAGMIVGTEANNPSFGGSCQGTRVALPIAELAREGRGKATETLIDITTMNRREEDDNRYVEIQLHGRETHTVDKITRVYIPEKEAASENGNALMKKLDEMGISHSVIADSASSITTRGLSAGSAGSAIEPHDPPKLIERVDISNTRDVLSLLEKHEKRIADSNIENAIVACRDGNVYQCFGTLNHVYPDVDLGEKLRGAFVTHNHPVGSVNEYSFSGGDINLFMEYDLSMLRGIDEKYSYMLTRNASDVDSHAPIFDITPESHRHEEVIEMAKILGIGYRRWERE